MTKSTQELNTFLDEMGFESKDEAINRMKNYDRIFTDVEGSTSITVLRTLAQEADFEPHAEDIDNLRIEILNYCEACSLDISNGLGLTYAELQAVYGNGQIEIEDAKEEKVTEETIVEENSKKAIIKRMEAAIEDIKSGKPLLKTQRKFFKGLIWATPAGRYDFERHFNLGSFVEESHKHLLKAYTCGWKSIFVNSLTIAIELNR